MIKVLSGSGVSASTGACSVAGSVSQCFSGFFISGELCLKFTVGRRHQCLPTSFGYLLVEGCLRDNI